MGRSRPAGGALTDPTYWDDYWRDLELPADVTPGAHTAIDPILEVIDRFVASDSPLSVLEIGGAPGRFLAHIRRRFGHRCACSTAHRSGSRWLGGISTCW